MMDANAPRHETQVQYHRRRAVELAAVRQPWEASWRERAEFVEPSRYKPILKNEAPVTRKSIIDSTGTFAYRTLRSGMHSGASSPARPWFRLTTPDPELREFAPVKEYLGTVETIMRETFGASNVYDCFHLGYGDLGLFGQSLGLFLGDDTSIVRMQQLVTGTFWIARDEKGRVTTMYRRFRWSVQRIIGRFGYNAVSQHIRALYDSGKYDQTFDIWHAIEPRMNRKPGNLAKWNKAFLSNYWEDQGTERLLEESGFDSNPLIGPAWELAADDHYATAPGEVVLGDVKMLQKEQQRKLEAIDKMVRPPMTGPTSMRNNPASILPGSITYSDEMNGKGFRPAMEVRVNLNDLRADIRDVQERINRAWYADLFMMLANLEGVQPRNVMELAERKEEKLLALGPVLENIYNGQFRPVIELTYEKLNAAGKLPPPPVEIQDQNLKIEYTSILAQAQKAVATGSVERLFAFGGQVAAMKPDVLDKLDGDQAIDEYAEMLGAPASIVVSDDKVKAIRERRAQQIQQQQQAEMAATMAPAAKAGAEAAAVMAGAAENPGAGDLLARLGMG